MSEKTTASAEKKTEAKSENSTFLPQKSDSSQFFGSSVDRILFLQRTIGNQAVGRLIKSGALQAKLRTEQPGDIYKQEVDRVADQMMRIPEPQKSSTNNFHIQRACLKCERNDLKLQTIKEEEETLQTKENSGFNFEVDPGIENQILSMKGGGQPIPESERAFFESRFGADFHHVRVHMGTESAELNQQVQAKAFTHGRDIYFGAEKYAPGSTAGKELLAHELTHVIQQTQPKALSHTFGDGTTMFVQRDADTAPSPSPPASTNVVVYNGQPQSPVNVGTPLSPDSGMLSDLLKQMIINHGETKTKEWVAGLDQSQWLEKDRADLKIEEDRNKYGAGDVSGAPLPDAAERKSHLHIKEDIVTKFKLEMAQWERRIVAFRQKYEQELFRTVNEMLDTSENQVYGQAMRYGIYLEPSGQNKGGIKSPFLPKDLPIPTERKALKTAAAELLQLILDQEKEVQMAPVLLTPPAGIYDMKIAQAKKRHAIISGHPILATYARDREKLADLAKGSDPYASAEKELNAILDKISWVRAEMKGNKDKLKSDVRLRSSTKRGLLVHTGTWEDRVIEDEVKDAAAGLELSESIKSIFEWGLLLMLFIPIPGVQIAALAGSTLMTGSQRYEDFLWEDAASGTAFDKALVISQSDPSLFRLGVEIAMGIGEGIVVVAVIGKAVLTFKNLSSLVREAIEARAAVKSAGDATAQAARATAEETIMGNLRERANAEQNGLGDRLQKAIQRDEFGRTPETMAPRTVPPGSVGSMRRFLQDRAVDLKTRVNELLEQANALPEKAPTKSDLLRKVKEVEPEANRLSRLGEDNMEANSEEALESSRNAIESMEIRLAELEESIYNSPKTPVQRPADRHTIRKVEENTWPDVKNTVIEPKVNVTEDVNAINEGKGVPSKTPDGLDTYTINGRVYGVHENGRLFPIKGEGFIELDRGAFKALGVYNKFGPTPRAEDILNNRGISPEQRTRALKAWKAGQ